MASRKQFAPLDPRDLIDELAEMYEPIAEEAGCARVSRRRSLPRTRRSAICCSAECFRKPIR
jgi:hypothetical protein